MGPAVSRPRARRGIAEVAAWINDLYEFDGPDDSVEWPSWKRLPDFLDDIVLGVMPDPSVAGWRIYPDGRVEVVRRGS
jgi:hypothetical protein